jgi:hypothetical protein
MAALRRQLSGDPRQDRSPPPGTLNPARESSPTKPSGHESSPRPGCLDLAQATSQPTAGSRERLTSPHTVGGDLETAIPIALPRRLLTRNRSPHQAWRSSMQMHGDGGDQGPSLMRPSSERLTLPLTVGIHLGKRGSAKRWAATYSHRSVLTEDYTRARPLRGVLRGVRGNEEHITWRSTVPTTCRNAGPHSGECKIHGKDGAAEPIRRRLDTPSDQQNDRKRSLAGRSVAARADEEHIPVP